MATESDRRSSDEDRVVLRTLVEVAAANQVTLTKLSDQLQVGLCLLEHVAEHTCEGSADARRQVEVQADIRRSSCLLLELYRTSHPRAALELDRLAKMEARVEQCCPADEPERCRHHCQHEPCAGGEHEPGSGEAEPGSAEPNRVVGAPYPPARRDDCEDDEPNKEEGPDVPQGPFRGFLEPGRVLQLLKIGSADDGAGDDPVVFETYSPYGKVAAPMSTVAADVSGAEAGNVVLATGNWYAAYSTDGGASFASLDPTTVFPNTADGGFCCDQVVQYVPSIDRFLWLMQFNRATQPGDTAGSPTGPNRYRLAAASPADVISSKCTGWTYWDLTSASFNLGTDWMDYPDLAIGENFVYLSGDRVTGAAGLLVVRIPLAEIGAGGTINFRFTTPADSALAYGGHLSQNTGDEVFWAGHRDNGTIQVFSWNEASTSYFWRDVALKQNWSKDATKLTSIAPDGNDWLAKLAGFPKFAVIGTTRRGDEVWFAWSAGSGDGGHGGFSFPHPHIQLVKIDTKNGFKLLEQTQIWNPDYAFAYPYLATNDRAEVGIALGWGGKPFYANSAVGIMGDFVVWYPELSDIATNRWGDYVTARRASPQPGMFAGFGYAVLKDKKLAAGYRFDPFYLLFGRKSVVNAGPIIR